MRSDSVLRDVEFRRYLVGRLLSGAGNVVTLVALPILAYRVSGSAGVTALVAACEAAPYLLFGLVAGALSDRWNRKRVMVGADLASVVIVASLPLAHWVGEVTVAHVLVVAFLGPTLGVLFDGAVFGALPMLVGRERIGEANSVLWAAQNLNELALPAIVGVLVAVVHPADLLALDAVTFAVSAALVGTLTRPLYDAGRARPPFGVGQLGRDIGEGLRYLVGHAGVRTMTMVSFTQCIAGGGLMGLMVVWTDRHLDVGTQGIRFGLVYGSWAVGGFAAALVLPVLLRVATPARVTLLALPVSAVLGIVVPAVEPWWAAAGVLAAWSVAYTMVTINAITYRQTVTPEHLLGRVNTAGRMLSWGVGWTGGALLAGLLVGPLGTVPTMQVLAAVPVAAVVLVWRSPLRGQEQPALAVAP